MGIGARRAYLSLRRNSWSNRYEELRRALQGVDTLPAWWMIWLITLAFTPVYVAFLISPQPMFGRANAVALLGVTALVASVGVKVLDIRLNYRCQQREH